MLKRKQHTEKHIAFHIQLKIVPKKAKARKQTENTKRMKNALWAKSERPAKVERRKPPSLFSSFFFWLSPTFPLQEEGIFRSFFRKTTKVYVFVF